MKVLILNPMTQQTGNVVRDVLYGCWCKGNRIGGATVPPFNLLVLTRILRDSGFKADFKDAQAEQSDIEAIKKEVHDYNVVVVLTSTMTFVEDANYLSSLKQIHPELITVVFGSHSTFMPKSCLSHEGIDIAIQHEPEMVLRDLVSRLETNSDYSDLAGIVFRRGNGEITINEPYPFIEDLNILPFPDIDLLPKDIHYFNPIVKRLPYITTATSKGCPGKCTFCTAPAFDGNRYRYQSAQYVIEELRYFISKGIKEVYFRDDTFFVKKKRDIEIFQSIVDNRLDVTWIANARVNMIDEETIGMAKAAGCHTIKFGIESGSQEILDNIKKGYRVEKAKDVFDLAKKHKIRTHAHVMIGNPGDTLETVMQTIDHVIHLDPTTASFGICTPYPGTPLFEQVKEEHPEIDDGSASDLSKLHTQGLYNEFYTSLAKNQLTRLVRKAYRRFYVRPSYWLKSAKWQISGINDIKRLSIAATNIFDFMYIGRD